MRACTAVVTEIAWNRGENPVKEYREIEFISEADWEEGLDVLYKDICGVRSHDYGHRCWSRVRKNKS